MRSKTFSGRPGSQMKVELKGLIKLFKDKGVQSYLEIGARDGDTFHDIMCALPIGSLGVAVDLPGGLWGKRTTINNLKLAVDDLKKRGYDIHLIVGDSQSQEVADMVAELGPYDAAFIDGDHTFKGVSRDWSLYQDMAPMVAFHDIVGHGQFEKVSKNAVEVPRFWDYIKNDNCLEFVAPNSAMGIGVWISAS